MENNTNIMNTDINNTNVVNVSVSKIRPKYKNLYEWMSNTDENFYIGRGHVVYINGIKYPLYDSIWSNPYKITKERPREIVIELYKNYIEKKLETNKNLIKELLKLKGKKLGCWCKPEYCHGDVLVKLIKKYDNEYQNKNENNI